MNTRIEIIYSQWVSIVILLGVLRTVNLQYLRPVGVYQPPPPPPVYVMAPPPVAVPMPYPVPMPVLVTTKPTTTTTTTAPSDNEKNSVIPFAVPVPVPLSFPFVVPQAPPICVDRPRSNKCAPCPQCVYAPRPIPPPILPPPIPMPVYPVAPAPPPVIVYPPLRCPIRAPTKVVDSDSSDSDTDTDTDDTDSSSSDTSDSRWHRRRRRRRHRMKIHPRSLETHEYRGRFRRNDRNKLVRPVLTYVSEKGKVKFRKRISEADADRLMEDADRSKSVEISRRSLRASKDNRKVKFRAPPNKSITNLSVSFNII